MIKEIREKASLSQVEFGELFGVKQNTVSMWESGERYPTRERARKIVKFAKDQPRRKRVPGVSLERVLGW